MSQLRSLTTGAAAVLVALAGACASAPQEESTSVVIRLGVDTVAVEQWVRRGQPERHAGHTLAEHGGAAADAVLR